MSERKGHTSDGDNELPSQPAFHIRSEAPFNLVTALLLLGSLIGILTYVGSFADRIEQNLRIEIRNEENKRLNQTQRLEQRIDSCCQRSR